MEGASVLRQGTPVVKNICWEIQPGQHWAVLGATGAGKSALGEAIAGDAVVVGEMRMQFGGRDLDPHEAVARVSFDLQRALLSRPDAYHQARWYQGEAEATPTVREVLAMDGQATSAIRIARRLGLGRLLRRRVLQLSMGEQRKLLIARAWARNPVLLVLDEPFVGLDAGTRVDFGRALEALMHDGPQVILLTTRPNELPRGLTHGLWLKRGRVLGAAPLSMRSQNRMARRTFPPVAVVRAPIPRTAVAHADDAEPIVELRKIRLTADGIPILRQVHWTVRAGERWALCGHNGAGKTTLLSMILGDHPQSFAQNVRLFGRHRGDGGSLWEWKAQVGWAAPDVAMNGGAMVSVFDLVCSGFVDTLSHYEARTLKQERRAWAWLRYFDLHHEADRPFRTLSDGQQRLALVARAMIKSPRLLILDEPCQGLDAAARARVLRALDAYAQDPHKTLVIVTHYAAELPHGITHRLELRRGRVLRCEAVTGRRTSRSE